MRHSRLKHRFGRLQAIPSHPRPTPTEVHKRSTIIVLHHRMCTLILATFGSRQDHCAEGALSAVYAPATTPRFTAVTNAHTDTKAATEDTTKAAIAAAT